MGQVWMTEGDVRTTFGKAELHVPGMNPVSVDTWQIEDEAGEEIEAGLIIRLPDGMTMGVRGGNLSSALGWAQQTYQSMAEQKGWV